MSSRKNPTNSDIFKEVKVIQTAVHDHGKRISDLELWKHDEELIKKTLHGQEEDKGINDKLVKAVWVALGIIASLLGVRIAS